ncbi:MAG: glycosyltransferase [Limisphaerales bacterium]
MKILQLGKFYPPHKGGIETLIRLLSEGCARAGDEVDCVVANTARRTVFETLNGVRVHRLASLGFVASTSLCPAYPGAARRFRPDIIEAHFPNPLADLAVLRAPRNVPVVLYYHSDIIRQAAVMGLYRHLLKRLLDRADRILVATPAHRDYSPWLPRWADKVEVLPYGIALARYLAVPEPAPAVEAARAAAAGRPVIVNVGRLVGYKGQRHLIEAMRDVPGVAWIVGSGPLEMELKATAAAAGVADRVKFWGEVDDALLPALLHAADVFALPSVTPNEGFALVQVEAMACGKPVVCCDLKSGVPYVNRHGVTGLVVPPADSGAFGAALRSILGDPARRAELGAAARRRALDEFSAEVMVRRHRELFRRLVQPAGPG